MVRVRATAIVTVLAGCRQLLGIDDPIVTGLDASGADSIDAPPGVLDVAHLSPATEVMLVGAGSLMLPSTTIDTTTGTVAPALPQGAVILSSAPQESGNDVMVIQAGSIAIDGLLIVAGSRPLVIVATTTLVVNANIDVAAMRAMPGPGGFGSGSGPGAGSAGLGGASLSDCGGGGGSFGGLGGSGGRCDGVGVGPSAGPVYGSQAVLEGGAGGGAGRGTNCAPPGGAGGGTLQLTAGVSITLATAASIDASGGGGTRAGACMNDGGSGAGGGAGGMIYLQAPMLLGSGRLGANGGGGAGGGSAGGGTLGGDGGDGTAASGGLGGVGAMGAAGGDGASGGTPGMPGTGTVNTDSNGGGGGGGAGRIFFHTNGPDPSYTTSPSAMKL
jgi:hypothetical protein